jgi:hypothetical protein
VTLAEELRILARQTLEQVEERRRAGVVDLATLGEARARLLAAKRQRVAAQEPAPRLRCACWNTPRTEHGHLAQRRRMACVLLTSSA